MVRVACACLLVSMLAACAGDRVMWDAMRGGPKTLTEEEVRHHNCLDYIMGGGAAMPNLCGPEYAAMARAVDESYSKNEVRYPDLNVIRR